MANRTIQFHGLAYGDSPVQMNAHINGQLVFSGSVATNPGPLPPATPEAIGPTPHPVLFSVLTDLFPTEFGGHYPMTVSVATGDGIILDEVTANYQPMSQEPGADFNGSINGTTLTVSSVTSGGIAVGQIVKNTSTSEIYGAIVSGSGTTWELKNAHIVPEGPLETFVSVPGNATTFGMAYTGAPPNAENNYDACSEVTIDGITQVEPGSGELGQKWWTVESGSTWACQLYVSQGDE